MTAIFRAAFSDMFTGLAMRSLWLALAQEDIDDQHRRTTLGPIWMVLNYFIYIAAFVLVFGGHSSIPNYIGYVSVGMLIFSFLQEIMGRSVTLFQQERAFIEGTTMPLTVYVMRMAAQSVIRTAYAAVGCLAIVLIAGTPVTVMWLWSIVGVGAILAIVVPVIILFAMAGAFFPDLQFIVTNIIRVSMFLTPIFWENAPGPREILARYNPFTYLIDLVRDPMVFGRLPLHSFFVSAIMIGVVWVAAMLLLGRYRREVVFLL